jgi:hypothetical protein
MEMFLGFLGLAAILLAIGYIAGGGPLIKITINKKDK